IDSEQTDVQCVCQPRRVRAVLFCIWYVLLNSRPKFIVQSSFTFLFLLTAAQRPFRGCCHSHDCGDIFCSGSSLVLVSAAEHDRLDREATPQEQKSNAFWSIKLVRTETGGINQ